MSAQDNIKTVESYFENHDPQFMADDATFHDYSQPEPLRGPQAIGALFDTLYNVAFPGAEAQVTNITADDRTVVIEFIFRGVNQGSLNGALPTGRRVEVPMCGVYEVAHNKIQRTRLYYDSALLAKQLGWIPGPELPTEAPVLK